MGTDSAGLLWPVGLWRCGYCIVEGRALVRLYEGLWMTARLEEGPRRYTENVPRK